MMKWVRHSGVRVVFRTGDYFCWCRVVVIVSPRNEHRLPWILNDVALSLNAYHGLSINPKSHVSVKTPSAQQWESPIASCEVSGSQELIRTHRRSIVWTSAKTARTLCQAATTTASSYMIFGKESTWNLFVKSYYNRWYGVIMLRLLCALSGWPLCWLDACRPIGTLFSKKYGVDHIRYAHGDTETVVYSSNKLDGNNVIRT